MAYASILGWLLPERCPSCGQPSAAGFCTTCRTAFAPLERPCTRCGLPRPVHQCPRRPGQWYLDNVLAPLCYVDPLDHYILAMKFHRSRKLGRALGLMLAEAIRATRAHANVDGLVPVPLHRRRLRERGYNQAFEIARTLSAELRLPIIVRGVTRPKSTLPQSGALASGRYVNVRHAFEVRRDVTGRRLAIVDDVVTTGATMNSLAAALQAAGAARLCGWAVARTV